MKLCYVAGPYRDKRGAYFVKKNIRAAEEVAVQLWRNGFAVICPHKNTEFFDGVVGDQELLDGDIEIIKRCDFVVMVEGWARSEGASWERYNAIKEGKKVYLSVEEAVKWESK